MTAPDPRLDEMQAIPAVAIEAAAKAIFGDPYGETWALQVSATQERCREDARLALEAAAPYMNAFLLAELRKAHEALERVWDEATMAIKSTIGAYSEGGVWAFEQAEKLNPNPFRAAVAAAKGDGE